MCERCDGHINLIHQDRAEYPPYLVSVTGARRRVRGVLEKWGYADLALDAELVTAELSGNAVLHGCVAGTVFWVRVAVAEAWLRVEVGDPAPGQWPQPRAAQDDSRCGRGLAIVGNLTHRWGVSCSPLGKAVWGDFDLSKT
jgi:hypothetical protein